MKLKNKIKKVGIISLIAIIIVMIIYFGKGGEKENTKQKQDVSVEEVVKPKENGNGQLFLIDENAVDKSEVIQAQKNPLSERNVFFAGYSDATLSKMSTVALENLPENEDFLMKYIITDIGTGDVVYETNLIPSGQCVVWVPGETMEVGTYHLQFLAIPYYYDGNGNFQQLTSGSNALQYTIVE